MTLPTMHPGDRVRITVEGEVKESISDAYLSLELGGGAGSAKTVILWSELTSPTAHVEVLPPQIEQGDLVCIRREAGTYEVLAIRGVEAWVENSGIERLHDLTLVSKASKAGGRV